MWVGVVTLKFEIFVFESEKVVNIGIYDHFRQLTRVSFELQLSLLDMV